MHIIIKSIKFIIFSLQYKKGNSSLHVYTKLKYYTVKEFIIITASKTRMTFSSCFDSPQSPPPPPSPLPPLLVDVVLFFSLLQENINTVRCMALTIILK